MNSLLFFTKKSYILQKKIKKRKTPTFTPKNLLYH